MYGSSSASGFFCEINFISVNTDVLESICLCFFLFSAAGKVFLRGKGNETRSAAVAGAAHGRPQRFRKPDKLSDQRKKALVMPPIWAPVRI